MSSARRVYPLEPVTVTTSAPWPSGRWPGLLSYWRRDADGWRGFVTFATDVGQQRLGWFPVDALRPGLPDGDQGGEVDVALKFSDRPAVADRSGPGQPQVRHTGAAAIQQDALNGGEAIDFRRC